MRLRVRKGRGRVGKGITRPNNAGQLLVYVYVCVSVHVEIYAKKIHVFLQLNYNQFTCTNSHTRTHTYVCYVAQILCNAFNLKNLMKSNTLVTYCSETVGFVGWMQKLKSLGCSCQARGFIGKCMLRAYILKKSVCQYYVTQSFKFYQ